MSILSKSIDIWQKLFDIYEARLRLPWFILIDFPRFIFQKIVIKDYSDILKIFINEFFSKRSNFHISQEFILK